MAISKANGLDVHQWPNSYDSTRMIRDSQYQSLRLFYTCGLHYIAVQILMYLLGVTIYCNFFSSKINSICHMIPKGPILFHLDPKQSPLSVPFPFSKTSSRKPVPTQPLSPSHLPSTTIRPCQNTFPLAASNHGADPTFKDRWPCTAKQSVSPIAQQHSFWPAKCSLIINPEQEHHGSGNSDPQPLSNPTTPVPGGRQRAFYHHVSTQPP